MTDYEYSYTKTLHIVLEKIICNQIKNQFNIIHDRFVIIIESVYGDDIQINWKSECQIDINNIPMEKNLAELLIFRLDSYIDLIITNLKREK